MTFEIVSLLPKVLDMKKISYYIFLNYRGVILIEIIKNLCFIHANINMYIVQYIVQHQAKKLLKHRSAKRCSGLG